MEALAKLEAEVVELRKSSASIEQDSVATVEAKHATEQAKNAERVLVRDMLLGDVFAAFDLDGDGYVDANELLQLGAARYARLLCCDLVTLV